MKIIHLNGFNDDERSTFKVAIYNNVVTSARALAKAAADFGIVLQDQVSILLKVKKLTVT